MAKEVSSHPDHSALTVVGKSRTPRKLVGSDIESAGKQINALFPELSVQDMTDCLKAIDQIVYTSPNGLVSFSSILDDVLFLQDATYSELLSYLMFYDTQIDEDLRIDLLNEEIWNEYRKRFQRRELAQLKNEREEYFKGVEATDVDTRIFGQNVISRFDRGISDDLRDIYLFNTFREFHYLTRRETHEDAPYTEAVMMEFIEFLHYNQDVAKELAERIIHSDSVARAQGNWEAAYNSAQARYYLRWIKDHEDDGSSGILGACFFNPFTIDSLKDSLDIFEKFLRFHVGLYQDSNIHSEEAVQDMYEARRRIWEMFFFGNGVPILDRDLELMRERIELLQTKTGIVDNWMLRTDVAGTASMRQNSYYAHRDHADLAMHIHEIDHLTVQGRVYVPEYHEDSNSRRLVSMNLEMTPFSNETCSLLEVMNVMLDASIERGSFILKPEEFIEFMKSSPRYFYLLNVYGVVLEAMPYDEQVVAIELLWESYFENWRPNYKGQYVEPENSAFSRLNTFFDSYFGNNFFRSMEEAFNEDYISPDQCRSALNVFAAIAAKRNIEVDVRKITENWSPAFSLDDIPFSETFVSIDETSDLEYMRTESSFIFRFKERPQVYARYEYKDGVVEIELKGRMRWYDVDLVTREFIRSLNRPVNQFLFINPHLFPLFTEYLKDISAHYSANPQSGLFEVLGDDSYWWEVSIFEDLISQRVLPQLKYLMQSIGVNNQEFLAIRDLYDIEESGLRIHYNAFPDDKIIFDTPYELNAAVERLPHFPEDLKDMLASLMYLKQDILSSNLVYYSPILAGALGREALRIRECYFDRVDPGGFSPEFIDALVQNNVFFVRRFAAMAQNRVDIACLSDDEFNEEIVKEIRAGMMGSSRIIIGGFEYIDDSFKRRYERYAEDIGAGAKSLDIVFDELVNFYIAVADMERAGQSKEVIATTIKEKYGEQIVYMNYFGFTWLQRVRRVLFQYE